jgi:hypothetical protein
MSPTLPKKGDVLRWVGTSVDPMRGREFVVVERRGRGIDYALVLRSLDGEWAGSHYPVYRKDGTTYGPDHLTLHEAGWWIGHGWEVAS